MEYRRRGLCILMVLLWALPATVRAQTSTSITITSPLTDAFPRVQTYLDVRDAQGNLISDLQPSDLQVLENGQVVPVAAVDELRPGLQFVVAFNPGASFAARDNQGTSRYDLLIQFLATWAKSRQGSSLDDYSLLVSAGSGTSHVNDPLLLLEALQKLAADKADPRADIPNLDTLFRAVDLAADPSRQPGVGRSVLFITAPIEGDIESSLENLIARARQLGVHVFVWMVSSPGSFSSNAADQLAAVSSRTGGQFFTYSGDEGLPDLEELFDSLRNVYRLTYISAVRAAGQNELVVELTTPEGKITSPSQQFEIKIQPPNPAFIAPALEILRKQPEEGAQFGQDEIPPSEYAPTEQNIQVLVDFPDGRVRPLARTSLYIDGVLVAENRAEPFDRFSWNLKPYAESGQHVLRVEAEDNFGLTGSSIETLVQVTIEIPQRSPWEAIYRNRPVLAGLGLVVGGSIIFLALLMTGRIQPQSLRANKKLRPRPETAPAPTAAKNENGLNRPWANILQWPQRRVTPQADAFLIRVYEGEQSPATPIPITADEITLGESPNHATLVFSDPTVDALHARLIRKEDGFFYLFDEGSIAGTWVNFSPVANTGTRLDHGDLIHIGSLAFRFTLSQPTAIRKPVILPDDTLVEVIREAA